jgi:predicted CoA-binding protein
MKTTLVIGASGNPDRYSYKAIKLLRQFGHPVHALGNKTDWVDDIEIKTEQTVLKDIDTVTLYINPAIQSYYKEYIYSISPKRIIFNPGTENPDFMQEAESRGIACEEACTLVLLNTHQY